MLAACPQDVCWRLVSSSCNANRRLRQLFAVRSRDPNTEGRCVYVLCVLCLLCVYVCVSLGMSHLFSIIPGGDAA